MNWGKGIIVVMSLFIGFILFLVINLMLHKVDLESEDYYSREINYEQEITEMENSNNLSEKIELVEQNDFVVVQIPAKINYSKIELEFKRPDNQKLDKIFKVEGTKSYLIPKKDLTKGTYSVEIRYISGAKNCLQKETIYI